MPDVHVNAGTLLCRLNYCCYCAEETGDAENDASDGHDPSPGLQAEEPDTGADVKKLQHLLDQLFAQYFLTDCTKLN